MSYRLLRNVFVYQRAFMLTLSYTEIERGTQNGTIALNSGTIYVPSTFINMLSDIENAGK